MSILNLISKLFYPSRIINSAYDINYWELYEEGFRGIIFDIDNTLVEHGAPANKKTVELMQKLDSMGFSIVFLSNNKEYRVKSFRDQALVRANYIYKGGKPGRKGYMRAMRLMNTDSETTVFIGDQLFTDVWGAKRCGIYNILTRPISPKEEIQIVLKRKLEKIVLHAYEKSDKTVGAHHRKIM